MDKLTKNHEKYFYFSIIIMLFSIIINTFLFYFKLTSLGNFIWFFLNFVIAFVYDKLFNYKNNDNFFDSAPFLIYYFIFYKLFSNCMYLYNGNRVNFCG
jgi:hypothetical protein